jgi:hypothetical protein
MGADMSDEPETPGPTVQVENADNVNASPEAHDVASHPAVIWLITIVTAGVLVGFGAVTYAVLSGEAGAGIDAATKGSIIQTWNNLAVAAAAVWTTSRVVDRIKGSAAK